MVSKVTSHREPSSVAAKGNRPAHDKGNIKVDDNIEVEQSLNFKVDPLMFKKALDIEAKR